MLILTTVNTWMWPRKMRLSTNLLTLNVGSLNTAWNSSIMENIRFLILKLQRCFL